MSHARGEYEDLKKTAPEIYDAVFALTQVAEKAGLDKHLLKLVKLRASQINGCAFCLQHHVLQSERLGLSPDKINLVAVWREAPIFSSRERAALAWTEALTFLPRGVSDDVFAEARREFSETELLYLTSAVASINVWNRFGVAYRWTPAGRQPVRVASSARAAGE